ncbi:MAG TPA: GNAT family N-acetyltransferase [Opitutaceae bacterium]|nr:GNAT family N-acetyltransferase [Opitutaceae bacterium]
MPKTAPSAATSFGTGDTAIRRIDPFDGTEWAELTNRFGASVFHSSEWGRVLHNTYGYRPVYFVLGGSKVSVGAILPVMEVDSWLTGRRGIALPFTDECDGCGDAGARMRSMFDAVVSYGRERKWRYFECRGTRTLAPDAPPSLSFHGHRLDLRRSEAELLRGIESSGRRAIRKAQESDLSIEISGEEEAVRAFYGLLGLTRRRHGLPPQPWRFFREIQRQLLAKGRGCVVLARRQGRAIAGAVYLHSGRTVLYKFGASDETQQQYRGNNLVMWEAIRWHAARGFESLDFGRTSLGNSGLRAFKQAWGTQEYPINYCKFDFRANAFVADSDRSTGWHAAIFGRLPLSVSRLVGAVLYKHIA